MDDHDLSGRTRLDARISPSPERSRLCETDAATVPPAWVPRWLQPDERRNFETIARHGRTALAWEVLRRDQRYRDEWAKMLVRVEDRPADPAFVARWGLHFP